MVIVKMDLKENRAVFAGEIHLLASFARILANFHQILATPIFERVSRVSAKEFMEETNHYKEKRKAPAYRRQAQDELRGGRFSATTAVNWLVTSSRWRLELDKKKSARRLPIG